MYSSTCVVHTPITRSIWANSTAHTPSIPSIWAASTQILLALAVRKYSILRVHSEHLVNASASTNSCKKHSTLHHPFRDQRGAFQGGILKPSKKRYKNLRKILQKSLPTGLFFITVLPFFGLLLLLLAYTRVGILRVLLLSRTNSKSFVQLCFFCTNYASHLAGFNFERCHH